MLVSDYKLQVREAFRVMKPGAAACFGVWGRKENSIQFTLFSRAREVLGLPPAGGPSNWHICDNYEAVKEEFTNAGFVGLKRWFAPCNWSYKDGADFVKRMGTNFPPGSISPEVAAKAEELYNEEGD